MCRQQLPILLLAILAVSGCDNDDARTVDPPAPTTEELIIADCYALRDALEAFAAENSGAFPGYLHDVTESGNQLITFLPGGVELSNRYSGLPIETTLMDPHWPGEIGAVVFRNDFSPDYGCTNPEGCDPVGYRIVGVGRYGELVRIENITAVDPRTITALDSVIANCDLVTATAHEFARLNGGVYAASTSGDPLPNGDVLTDLLPGGRLLTNPYYGYRSEPIDGAAGWAGSIGYSPNDRNGEGLWDGFQVDAVGPDGATTIARRGRESPGDGTVRWTALVIRDAAENFASQNGGEYPRDIDMDETPSGETLLELLSCAWCTNPYTGAPAIRNGLATSRGEVGYVPLEYNGIVVGYVINALGLFNEELERFEVLTN